MYNTNAGAQDPFFKFFLDAFARCLRPFAIPLLIPPGLMRDSGMKGALGLVAVAVAAIFCGGCERADQEIKVYRVAKAPLDQTPPPEASMPTNASSPSSLPNASLSNPTTAEAPKNWEPQPLSQMRQASFVVHGENGAMADISFVVLGPAAGNVLDNVNRWLGQLKQPAVSEEKLKTMIQVLNTPRETSLSSIFPVNRRTAIQPRTVGSSARWRRTRTAWVSLRCGATRPWSARRRKTSSNG